MRIFYASFHPEYNGVPPDLSRSPGYFHYRRQANMLGYHAISSCASSNPRGILAGLFFNPNSEGRQNWGQAIQPSVSGNGEPMENLLPVHQFVSAFTHFTTTICNWKGSRKVPKEPVTKVEKLARESWGASIYGVFD